MKKESEKVHPEQVRKFFDVLIKVIIAISTCFTAPQI